MYNVVSIWKPVSAELPLAASSTLLGKVTSLSISISLLNLAVIAPVGALLNVIVVPLKEQDPNDMGRNDFYNLVRNTNQLDLSSLVKLKFSLW